MTAGTFTRSAAGTARDMLSGKSVRTPVALPSDLADAKRAVATPSGGPAHAKPRPGINVGLGAATGRGARTATAVGGGERRKLGKAFFGLAAISLILIFAGVAARHIHVTPVNPTAGATNAHTAAASGGTDVSRLQDATTEAQSATLPLRTEMSSIPDMPTPQQVSTVSNPYVDLLGIYEAVLASTPAPAAAGKAVHALETQLRSDVANFSGAATVPRNDLGTFINSFLARSTLLQKDMSNLQLALRSSAH